MGAIELLIGVIVFFGGGMLVNALFNELLEWQPWFRNWFLRVIVSRLPEEERAIRYEEWAAHMEECPGTFSKLVLLFGFWRAGHSIVREFERQETAQRKTEQKKAPTPAEPSKPGEEDYPHISIGANTLRTDPVVTLSPEEFKRIFGATLMLSENFNALKTPIGPLNNLAAGRYDMILRNWNSKPFVYDRELFRNLFAHQQLIPNQDLINKFANSLRRARDEEGE